MPQPIVDGIMEGIMEGIMVNVTVGAAPKGLVYIGVHRDFGSHAWLPYHGAKHSGSAEKEADAGSLKFWHQKRSGEAQALPRTPVLQHAAHGVGACIKKASATGKHDFESRPPCRHSSSWYAPMHLRTCSSSPAAHV